MVGSVAYPEECINDLIHFAIEYSDRLEGVYYRPTGGVNIEKGRLCFVLD